MHYTFNDLCKSSKIFDVVSSYMYNRVVDYLKNIYILLDR